MKNFTLIACLTLGLISCSNTGYEKKIPGSWCEPIPGRAQDVQGIKFQKDGKASSINMATLQYKSWKINGKTLILEGESTGNRHKMSVPYAYSAKANTTSRYYMKGKKDSASSTTSPLNVAGKVTY